MSSRDQPMQSFTATTTNALDFLGTAKRGFPSGCRMTCSVCQRSRTIKTPEEIAPYLVNGWPKCPGPKSTPHRLTRVLVEAL